MAEAPVFFVPGAKLGEEEERYTAFAEVCLRAPVPGG